ncbi:MAG: polyhydroxyalkanoate depolymerase, partial [Dokdonella sp.]
MLYHLHELNRSLINPLVGWSGAAAHLLTAKENWLSHFPGVQRLAAGYELAYRLGKDYEKPPFAIESVIAHGHETPISERVSIAKPFCNLIRFKRFSDDCANLAELKQDPVVLVVAPLSGHHSTLLRDTVTSLLQDHKVYLTDWVDARMVPLDQGDFDLDT